MKDLSIIIPARKEMFLKNTIEDALSHLEADTEIIVTLDGEWANPPLMQHERVNVIYVPQSLGQRGGANIAAKLSKAKYLAKVDAHCSFDQGFDRKMIEFMEKVGDDVTALPIMRNLHAFDWKCYHCGWKKYQGPTPEKCEQCGRSDKLRRKMIWVGKNNPQSVSFCFDATPHFRYFEEYKHREPFLTDKKEKGYTETMSIQGSFFMLTREKYWELNICDESLGNWGNQGIEVACKTWLSGGRCLVNHNTWYAHMFRTQGGDFGFPWPVSGRATEKTKLRVKNLFWNHQFNKQIHPLSFLIEKFSPIPGWSEEEIDHLKNNSFDNILTSTLYSPYGN